jgi:hypothetical protein
MPEAQPICRAAFGTRLTYTVHPGFQSEPHSATGPRSRRDKRLGAGFCGSAAPARGRSLNIRDNSLAGDGRILWPAPRQLMVQRPGSGVAASSPALETLLRPKSLPPGSMGERLGKAIEDGVSDSCSRKGCSLAPILVWNWECSSKGGLREIVPCGKRERVDVRSSAKERYEDHLAKSEQD